MSTLLTHDGRAVRLAAANRIGLEGGDPAGEADAAVGAHAEAPWAPGFNHNPSQGVMPGPSQRVYTDADGVLTG